MTRFLFLALCVVLAGPGRAQQAPPTEPPVQQTVEAMTVERLLAILRALDSEMRPQAGGIALTIADVPVQVFLDPRANRMRALVPIASAEGLTEADLMRVLQANFDTALDARYAIAQGRLWSVFIHPLRQLERDQLISGIAQTVTLARTYGSFYASGATVFGSGDSGALHDELFRELRERGQEL